MLFFNEPLAGKLMVPQKVVMLAQAGTRYLGNQLEILDSRFHANDKIMPLPSYYASIKVALHRGSGEIRNIHDAHQVPVHP